MSLDARLATHLLIVLLLLLPGLGGVFIQGDEDLQRRLSLAEPPSPTPATLADSGPIPAATAPAPGEPTPAARGAAAFLTPVPPSPTPLLPTATSLPAATTIAALPSPTPSLSSARATRALPQGQGRVALAQPLPPPNRDEPSADEEPLPLPPTRAAEPAPAPRPSRFGGPPLIPDRQLERIIHGLIAENGGGTFGVAVKDLDSGRGALIESDREFPAASLFKLPVMYEVFKQRDAGTLRFTEVLWVTAEAASYDLGTLTVPVNGGLYLGDALERMITYSDNVSAWLLLRRTGALTLNQDMAALGLVHTRVRLDDLSTSPGDMLDLLELIHHGHGLEAGTAGEMIALLLAQQVNDRLPALLPEGTLVAHKTGNWGGAAHDVGIVYSPAATYAIAALTEDLPDVARGSRTIARISRAVYDYFNGELPPHTVSPPPTPGRNAIVRGTFPPPSSTPTSTPEPSPMLEAAPTLEASPTAAGSPTRRLRATATPRPSARPSATRAAGATVNRSPQATASPARESDQGA